MFVYKMRMPDKWPAAWLTTIPALVLFAAFSQPVVAGQWRGHVSAQALWFSQPAAFPGQHNAYLSAAVQPEYFHEWNNGYDLFSFTGFYRQDQYDDDRSRGDIRELSWLHAGDDWELTVGIGKVFWGVTESIHLVDIINQSDTVENLDGEDKLGQPMINLQLIRDWGILSAFVLPGFRERTYPGAEGRPRFAIPIDTDNAVYQDAAGERHVDFALRYAHSVGDWDIGLSWFNGTSREPRFVVNGVVVNGIPVSIAPLYEQITQFGLDLQLVSGSWLWKLEAINRIGQGKTFVATAIGFEYTFVGVLESDMDIGMIVEYLYDGRDDNVTTSPFTASPFQNDLVIGARLTLNDVQSSEILASVVEDLDGQGRSYNIEASRRMGDSFKLSLEARGVSAAEPGTTLASFNRDNRVSLELVYYF